MSSSMVLGSDHSITGLNLGEDLQTRNDHPHHHHHHHHHHGQTAATATVRSSSSSGSGGTNGTSTNCRRKSSRGTNDGCKKKTPQRGMGVAQLERLRLQERWKKITQINPPCPSTSSSCLTNTSPLLLSTGTIDTSVFSPESTTKAQFPKFHGFGNGVVSTAGSSSLLQQQQQQGFHGQGFVSADHHHHHDLIQGYLYGIGNMISNGGNSKELPSTPKVVNKCFTHDHCSDCHKKKRTFNGENLMFNEINKYGINSHAGVGGCDFTGLSIGVKGGGGDHLDQKKTPLFLQSGMGFCNTEPPIEVEMVDVQQKKGNSESVGMINNENKGGGRVVMEYEFFPSSVKGCYRRSNGVISNNEHDDHDDNQLLMMKTWMTKSSQEESDHPVLLVMGCGGGEGEEGGEGFYSKSCFATTATATTTIISGSSSRTAAGGYTGGGSVDASSSIDLSLRLSY